MTTWGKHVVWKQACVPSLVQSSVKKSFLKVMDSDRTFDFASLISYLITARQRMSVAGSSAMWQICQRPLMYTVWLPTIQNKRACCWPIQISLHLPVVWLLSESNRQHKKNTHIYAHIKVHMTTDYSARGVYRVTWLLTPVNEPNAMEIKWRFVWWCLLLCHNAFSPLIKKPFHWKTCIMLHLLFLEATAETWLCVQLMSMYSKTMHRSFILHFLVWMKPFNLNVLFFLAILISMR